MNRPGSPHSARPLARKRAYALSWGTSSPGKRSRPVTGNSRTGSQVGRDNMRHRSGTRSLSRHTKASDTPSVGPSRALRSNSLRRLVYPSSSRLHEKMQTRPHAAGIFVQHGACLRCANHAFSRRSPVGTAASRLAYQHSGACSRSISQGLNADRASGSSRVTVAGPLDPLLPEPKFPR
jgi:hypothetical protein